MITDMLASQHFESGAQRLVAEQSLSGSVRALVSRAGSSAGESQDFSDVSFDRFKTCKDLLQFTW